MLKTSARDFLAERCPKTLVNEWQESDEGYSPELWQEMAGLGWVGLAFPEEYGGAGMSFLDLSVLLEEMGRACLLGPFFPTVILGGLPILDIGSEEQKRIYLTKIASGGLIFTLALTEPSGRYDAASIMTTAEAYEDEYIINGTKLFVPGAHIAGYMLVLARTDMEAKPEEGITILIVDTKGPGISCSLLKTITGDKLCKIDFDKVGVPKQNILGRLNQGWSEAERIIQRAAVAKCCELVGAAQQVLEMTLDYAKTRKQFGHPIGSFQAIQHHCANMAIDVEGSRTITYQAAWMLSEGLPCSKEVAMAKAWTANAYRRITALSHQIHGAIAFTTDHDLHLFSKRAKAGEVSFGDISFYQEKVAQEIGLE
ncbi:MAG: acyl-CoA/acyl-ACP dehydrogenase [Chloroflexota bacterium]|nr:MAG: acyl-CoA/acyl-ACP dehydrogenase [Chloroflexota bacterium]